MSQNSKELILYWAPQDYFGELKTEINSSKLALVHAEANFFLCEGRFENLAWSQSTWRHCQKTTCESISKAAKSLKEQRPFWVGKSIHYQRRTQLILDQSRELNNKENSFPTPLEKKAFGGFSLLSETEMISSVSVSPPISPEGIRWKEDPSLPSRAYLKLWEALTVHLENFPIKAKCLEIGASPGGWTAVLRSLDCEVWAFDRSELAPALMKDPKVHFQKKDAFSLRAEDFPQVEWVFSDVICYPEKLFNWVQEWMKASPKTKFICTIKFQGPTDFESVRKFKEIPDSRTLHLHANKHELTWIKT